MPITSTIKRPTWLFSRNCLLFPTRQKASSNPKKFDVTNNLQSTVSHGWENELMLNWWFFLLSGVDADPPSKQLLNKIFVEDGYNPDATPESFSDFLIAKIIGDPQFLSRSPWNLLLHVNESFQFNKSALINASLSYDPVFVSIHFELTKLIDLVRFYDLSFTGWFDWRVLAQFF